MRHTPDEIKRELSEFAIVTGQPDLNYVVSYAIGYFGYITPLIWSVIQELRKEGIIK